MPELGLEDAQRQELLTTYSQAVSFLRAEYTLVQHRERGFYDAVRNRLQEINGSDELGLPGELSRLDSQLERIMAALDQAMERASIYDGI